MRPRGAGANALLSPGYALSSQYDVCEKITYFQGGTPSESRRQPSLWAHTFFSDAGLCGGVSITTSAHCDELGRNHVNSNPVARRPLPCFYCPAVRRYHDRFSSPRLCSSKD